MSGQLTLGKSFVWVGTQNFGRKRLTKLHKSLKDPQQRWKKRRLPQPTFLSGKPARHLQNNKDKFYRLIKFCLWNTLTQFFQLFGQNSSHSAFDRQK